jgi:hypothetical protein
MDAQRFPEARLWDEINRAESRMTPQQERMWQVARVLPETWRLDARHAVRGDFWIVAVLGRTVVWYNDLEHGFNWSTWSRYGTIADYGSWQDDLEQAVQWLVNAVDSGQTLDPPSERTRR